MINREIEREGGAERGSLVPFGRVKNGFASFFSVAMKLQKRFGEPGKRSFR